MASKNTDNSPDTDEPKRGCKYLADQSREEEIIESIQEVAEIAGEPLRQCDYEQVQKEHDLDILNLSTIQCESDDWISTCQQAGVEAGVGGPDFNADDIISAIQQAAEERGEPLRIVDYLEWRNSVEARIPHPETIQSGEVFESWTEACKAAGVKRGITNFNRDETITAIQQAAVDKGEPLTYSDYREWSTSTDKTVPTSSTIEKGVCGPWTEACKAAGVKSAFSSYTAEEIVSAIQQAAEERGEPLRIVDYKKWRKSVDRPTPSINKIYDSGLGRWTEACETAGVEHGTPGK